MLQKTEHRGPDAHGLYADGEIQGSSKISDLESRARVCLGHSELSIVRGEEGEIQPDSIASDRGDLRWQFAENRAVCR